MSAQMSRPNGEFFDTKSFTVNVNGAATEWHLRVYPNGRSTDDVNHVSLFLHLGKGTLPIRAQGFVNIVGKNRRQAGDFVKSFTENTGCGHSKFISHAELNNPELGLLQNDTLNILVDLCVLGKETSSVGSSELTVPDVNVVPDISATFNMEEFSDFVVKCGGKKFKCHKVTLACRSPVFNAMIMSNMRESNESEMSIDDFDEDTIESLLKYIYFDKVASLDKQAESLLAAADKYDLAGLKAICEGNLAQRVNLENAVDLILLADMHNAASLKNYILKYISGSVAAISQKRENIVKLAKNPDLMAELFSKSPF